MRVNLDAQVPCKLPSQCEFFSNQAGRMQRNRKLQAFSDFCTSLGRPLQPGNGCTVFTNGRCRCKPPRRFCRDCTSCQRCQCDPRLRLEAPGSLISQSQALMGTRLSSWAASRVRALSLHHWHACRYELFGAKRSSEGSCDSTTAM